MIRGHIDFASRSLVEGWLYTSIKPLHGEIVLAFVDEICVGSGTVGLFRQDLADAGLGDGFHGFSFPVALLPWQEPRLIDIRMESSPLRMCQEGALAATRATAGRERVRPTPDRLALSWMLANGWLDQTHHDALRGLGHFGLQSVPIRAASGNGETKIESPDVARTLEPCFEYLLLATVRLAVFEVRSQDELIRAFNDWRDKQPPWIPSIVGLWREKPTDVRLVEGSHERVEAEEQSRAGSDILAGAIEHPFGGSVALLLNLDAHFALREDEGAYVVLLPDLGRTAKT